MTPAERDAMTPRELTVWSVAFVSKVEGGNSILASATGADRAVEQVRLLDPFEPRPCNDDDDTSRSSFIAKYREAHVALHRMWTAAVGSATYDKASWRALDNALSYFAREAAAKFGIGPTESLLKDKIS